MQSGQLARFLRKMTTFSVAVFILGLFSYAFVSGFSLIDASKRAESMKNIDAMENRVADLETGLSAIEKQITLSFAQKMGFEESPSVRYVRVEPLTQAYRSDEI